MTLTLPKGYEYENKVEKPAATPTPKPTATPTPAPEPDDGADYEIVLPPATPTPQPYVDQGMFNAVAYADRYPDLKALYGYDPIALWNHYDTIGRYEGRIPY